MGFSSAFASPGFLLAVFVGLVGGLLCVLRPESVRAFAARHNPDMSERFGSTEAHVRFIELCGWTLLALAAGLSLLSLAVAH